MVVAISQRSAVFSWTFNPLCKSRVNVSDPRSKSCSVSFPTLFCADKTQRNGLLSNNNWDFLLSGQVFTQRAAEGENICISQTYGVQHVGTFMGVDFKKSSTTQCGYSFACGRGLILFVSFGNSLDEEVDGEWQILKRRIFFFQKAFSVCWQCVFLCRASES